VLWSAFGLPQLTELGRPGRGRSAAEDVRALADTLIDAIGGLSADVPSDLAALLVDAPAGAEELARRLRLVQRAAGVPETEPVLGTPAAAASAGSQASAAGAARPATGGRRRREGLALLGAVALVAAAAAVRLLSGDGGASPAAVDDLLDDRAKNCTSPSDGADEGVAVTAPAPRAVVPSAVPVRGRGEAGERIQVFVYSPGICLYYVEPEWGVRVRDDGTWDATIDTGVAKGDRAVLVAARLTEPGAAELAEVFKRFSRRLDDPHVVRLPTGTRSARVGITVG
jgi:hypothetical protein